METRPHQSRFWKLSGSLAGLITLLVILVAVNVIIGQWRVRKDFTQEKLYTLSDGTRKVLGRLDRDVTLMFFFNSSAPDVPAPLKVFAQQVEDLLKEYELAGGGRVMVEKYDPKPDSDSEDLAQRYGLTGEAVTPTGPVMYLGLVAVSGDQQATIPMIDPRTEDLLEYNITRMIHRITTARKPVVGVMSSLPVMGSGPSPMMMPGQRPPQDPPWAAFRELSQDYEVRIVSPSAESIEHDVDSLVVVHPKDLSDKSLYAIDQFVLRGGHLLAFIDPFCVADPGGEVGGMSQYGAPSRSSTLGVLFDAWGVKYYAGKILADLNASTQLRSRNNTVENSPLYLSLRKGNMAAGDVLTSSIDSVMMVMAGALGNEVADGLKLTPLITSSEQSALADTMMVQFDPGAFRRELKNGRSRYNLAVRLQGKFKTAFPAGQPKTPGETNQVVSADHLAVSKGTGNVIVVADVDMLYNEFCGRDVNFLGMTGFQPFNQNINLFANMIEQMAGSSDLIGIRCRGRTERPFTRVLELQGQAQAQWLEQEQALEEKLQATQRRMDELQQKKDDKQRFVISPEQQKELAGFRQEVAKYKQELKQVRRNLREGIEALGVKIKFINILAMPLLVVLAGIGLAVGHRVKTRK